MWKVLIVTIVPFLAITQAFYVVPEDEIIKNYRHARAALTPEQREFLMELMAADDAIIDTASRGIVDDILQVISGTGGNIRVNVIGGSPQPQQPQPQQQQVQQVQQPQPSLNLINPSFTVVGSTQEKTLLNNTDANTIAAMAIASAISGTAPSMPMSDISSPVSSSAPAASSGVPVSSSPKQTITIGLGSLTGSTNNVVPQQQQQQSNITTIGGNNNHLLSTISQVIRNSNSRNVTGIVDESLRIATPAPIREFVTGLLNVVYCNGIRRLLGRC